MSPDATCKKLGAPTEKFVQISMGDIVRQAQAKRLAFEQVDENEMSTPVSTSSDIDVPAPDALLVFVQTVGEFPTNKNDMFSLARTGRLSRIFVPFNTVSVDELDDARLVKLYNILEGLANNASYWEKRICSAREDRLAYIAKKLQKSYDRACTEVMHLFYEHK